MSRRQGCTATWRAWKEWLTPEGDIAVDQLRCDWPDVDVSVSDTRRCEILHGKCETMKLQTYLQWWQQRSPGEASYLYLKDWHCAQLLKNRPFYTTPSYFADDWLSPFYEQRAQSSPASPPVTSSSLDVGTDASEAPQTGDYRFVYLGPKGSWTPVHADVLRSFSWSVNISGHKRWKLLPPELTHLLYDKTGKSVAPDFSLHGIPGLKPQDFPNLDLAFELAVTLDQGPGECLFVPSGWHHAVYNVTDALSVNENWVNAFNVLWSWRLLKETYLLSQHHISDCQETCEGRAEFEQLTQRLVEADCGMSFLDFIEFLHFALNAQTHVPGRADRDAWRRFRLARIGQVLSELQRLAGHHVNVFI